MQRIIQKLAGMSRAKYWQATIHARVYFALAGGVFYSYQKRQLMNLEEDNCHMKHEAENSRILATGSDPVINTFWELTPRDAPPHPSYYYGILPGLFFGFFFELAPYAAYRFHQERSIVVMKHIQIMMNERNANTEYHVEKAKREMKNTP